MPAYIFQYWNKDATTENATVVSKTFKNSGLLIAEMRKDKQLLEDNHWTVLVDLDEFDNKGNMIVNKGSFTVAHSQWDRHELNLRMMGNSAYILNKIPGLRQVFLRLYDTKIKV